MRLSESQLDAVVRRELQEVASRWRAPRQDGTGTTPGRRSRRPRSGLRSAPLAGALGLALAAGAVGLVLRPSFGDRVERGQRAPAAATAGRPQPGDVGHPGRRTGTAIAWDDRLGRAVLFGDRRDSLDSSGPAGPATWTWGDGGWRLEHPAVEPSPRDAAAMAYDPRRGSVILFGGALGTTAYGDTWAYDGGTWHELHPDASPPPGPAVMAWDSARGELVLVPIDDDRVGGRKGSAVQTYAWTGSSWRVVAPAPRLRGASLADDPAAGVLVLVARPYDPRWQEATTYTWDGGAWHEASPLPPFLFLAALISDAGVAFDPTTRQVVLYEDSTTWSWAGDWGFRHDYRQDLGGPAAGGGVVTDPRLGRVILFGGPTDDHPFAHAWAWDGHTWELLGA